MFLPPADGWPTAAAAVASAARPAATVPSTILRTVVMSCVLPSLRDSPRTPLCAGPANAACLAAPRLLHAPCRRRLATHVHARPRRHRERAGAGRRSLGRT